MSPMRIAQVSGHYPPNFVSGGTLVPQRVALAAHRAGHESYVYAGYLDKNRRPLETWDEDVEGVHVTWLVTTPWTAWDDERNWDNPEATAAFRTWLDRVRPQVVHFHSIQTLGVGLVEAAHNAGARVVLTMHDFWWFCSHQFLVNEDMRPTSLVADLGACDCETGGPALRERSARMRRALDAVDVVLAPSASAARVYAANGVDASILRVDENGLPDEQLATLTRTAALRPREAAGPLRLMYAGGAQAMKGFDVLVDACRRLEDVSELVLDAYGTHEAHVRNLPAWVRLEPAFAPEELPTVLAKHDFLVLPSVMRESHSILTREALAAGLGVVCTDTLGPEEAVEDGFNGLIIPAGNPEALANALRELASDPSTARSMTGRGSSSPIRTFSDQAAGILKLYEDLVDGPSAPSAQADSQAAVRDAQRSLLHRILFIVGISGAPLRYRVHLPAEALRIRGYHTDVRHYRDPELTEIAGKADAVVLYRVPATNQILELINSIKDSDRTVPILFDVDDLIFDPSLRGTLDNLDGLSDAEADLWWHGVERYRTTLENSDAYIGSTQVLCDRANELTGLPAYRFANGVGRILARASDAAVASPRTPGPPRIGYFSGTTTHDADWASIESTVTAVMERHQDVVLVLGGHIQPTTALQRFGDRVQRLPFLDWQELPRALRDTDICLAPLTGDSVFNESKSAIKWLEAALVETPTIASPTQPFREAIDDGRTGYLAKTPQEWERALETLLESPRARARVGAHARREALLNYSPYLQAVVYENILIDVALAVREHGHRAHSGWKDVADDEPFSGVDARVDAYVAVPVPDAPPVSRTHRMLLKTQDLFQREGAVAVVKRAVRVIRRTVAKR